MFKDQFKVTHLKNRWNLSTVKLLIISIFLVRKIQCLAFFILICSLLEKMKKSEKSFIKKNDFFFMTSIMKQRRNLRKICGQLINGFCSISPKIIRGEKQNTRKWSPLTLCLHKRQVMLDAAKFCSCFCSCGAGDIYLGPNYTKSQEFQI